MLFWFSIISQVVLHVIDFSADQGLDCKVCQIIINTIKVP
jgi:hypothetical protein